MIVKTIAVEYGRKFNLGNFESATINTTTWADLEEGEDPEACRQQLFDAAKASVRKNAMPLMKARIEQVNEIISGLPPELQEAVRTAVSGKNGG